MQHALVFDSHILPDGHLACPQEFLHHKSARFKVLVLFDEPEREASEADMELAAVEDTGNEFLSQEELSYYLSLDNNRG